MQRAHSANTRADKNTGALAVNFFRVKLCIIKGKTRGGQCKLRVTIHALNFFFVNELHWVEVQNLAGNLRTIIRRIELGYFDDTACAGFKRVPKIFFADADWGNGAESRDYNSIFLNQN